MPGLIAVVPAGPDFAAETAEEGREGGGDETDDMASLFKRQPLVLQW